MLEGDEAETTLGMSHHPRLDICLVSTSVTSDQLLWRIIGVLVLLVLLHPVLVVGLELAVVHGAVVIGAALLPPPLQVFIASPPAYPGPHDWHGMGTFYVFVEAHEGTEGLGAMLAAMSLLLMRVTLLVFLKLFFSSKELGTRNTLEGALMFLSVSLQRKLMVGGESTFVMATMQLHQF